MSLQFAAGSVELVNMTPEGAVLLFNMYYCVFVKEELMWEGLKEKTEAVREANSQRRGWATVGPVSHLIPGFTESYVPQQLPTLVVVELDMSPPLPLIPISHHCC